MMKKVIISALIAIGVFLLGLFLCMLAAQHLQLNSPDGPIILLSALYVSMVIAVSAYLLIATRK